MNTTLYYSAYPSATLRLVWSEESHSRSHGALLAAARRRLAELVSPSQARRAKVRLYSSPGRTTFFAEAPFALSRLLPAPQRRGRIDLSFYHAEIMTMVARGMFDGDIAEDLGASVSGVRKYRHAHGIPSGRSVRGKAWRGSTK